MSKNKRFAGPVVEIIFLAVLISLICLVCNLLKVRGYITEAQTFETSLVVIKNVFSKPGIKYIISNTVSNFKSLEPLVLVILSLIAVSIMDASGLLKQLFKPLKKVKPIFITGLVIFVGIISTILGDSSYTLLLPLAGILYKYINRPPSLGILTMFIGITIGYGTGLIYNYQMYELGNITELSAQSITVGYNYALLSNIFILIVSTIILTIVGTIVLERFSKKFPRYEEEDNLNMSKKASRLTLIVFIILIGILIYSLIPGLPFSGLLLDKTEPTYIGKIFGAESPFSQGLLFLIIAALMVCGFVYGTISRNIKNTRDYSSALTKTFEKTGYVFVLLFFISVLYEILDWTNFSTVMTTNIVDFIGSTNVSGLILVIIGFISILIISLFIPSTVAKWKLIAPVYVPLFMRANISPTFTQMVFQAADSVGKLFSPIYIFLIITIGFMNKYSEEETSIFGTLRKIMPVILILGATWLIIIVGWFMLGIPTGINAHITL